MRVSTVRSAQHAVHLERPLPIDIDDAVAAIAGDTEQMLTLAPFTPFGIEMKRTAQRGAPYSIRLRLGERGERFTGELNLSRGSDGSTALALDGQFLGAPGRLTPEETADAIAVHAFFDQVVRRLGMVAAERSALQGVPLELVQARLRKQYDSFHDRCPHLTVDRGGSGVPTPSRMSDR